MILVSMWLLCTITVTVTAQIQSNSSNGSSSASELDGLLQEYALEAFLGRRRAKTGVAYDASISSNSNLSGILVSAMRLKSGSLMTRGVSSYHEFEIPTGVVTSPYVERLALLYHNLANRSTLYYPPLPGYTYLAPVVGLLACQLDLPPSLLHLHLHLRASARPISIHFSELLPLPPTAKCVFFDVNGSVTLSDMLPGGVCTTFRQGHFSVVAEESIPSLPPNPRGSKKVWGFVVGGVLVLVLVLLFWCKYKQRKGKRKMKRKKMEMAAEGSEALYMTAIGATKAPAATPTRTLPQLENDYVP